MATDQSVATEIAALKRKVKEIIGNVNNLKKQLEKREVTLEKMRAWNNAYHPYAYLPERHFIVYFGNNIAEVFYNETIFDYRRGE